MPEFLHRPDICLYCIELVVTQMCAIKTKSVGIIKYSRSFITG